jgi:hypothetical protein
VFDLVGYLGVEKDLPEQLYHHYQIQRREVWNCNTRRRKKEEYNLQHVKKRI